MNVLYSIIGRDYHEMVVRKIMHKMNVKTQLAVAELWDVPDDLFERVFDFFDVYYGKYENYKESNKCEAVDEQLLEAISKYSLETIRMMDRHYTFDANYEERLQLYIKHISFWNTVLKEYSIDYVVFFNLPHEVFDFTIYSLCRVKNIKTIFLFSVPSMIFRSRGFICSDFLNVWKELTSDNTNNEEGIQAFQRLYSLCKLSEEGEFVDTQWSGFASRKKAIERDVNYDLRIYCLKKSKKGELLGTYKKRLERVCYGKRYVFLRRWVFWKHIRDNKRRLAYYESHSSSPVEGEKYFFFAIHHQPEATSAPLAEIYAEQIIPIKMVSSCLPRDYKLYIKEHPTQTNIGRDKCFYDELRKIKNVRMISMKYDSGVLLKNAVATVTLTGTIAIESVINGLPCITFGNFIYNALEGVLPVKTNEECKKAINDIVSGRVIIDMEKVKSFFCILYQKSLPFNVGYGVYNYVKNADIVSKEIIKIMKNEVK